MSKRKHEISLNDRCGGALVVDLPSDQTWSETDQEGSDR